MPIVSLAQAKDHLRITSDDSDGDVNLKLVQAEAIILNYLKGRTTAIATISVASPTVITTSVPHSLTSGAASVIAGTTTTPTVNGAQVVTVTGPTTFTVPVAVTIGQSTAAGTVASPTWTSATVPGNVQAAILLMLSHLHERRGDDMEKADEALWDALFRLLNRHRDPALA